MATHPLAPAPAAAPSDRQVRHLDRLARLLDSAIPVGGGHRIGLDGLIGLIPGIGDAVGAAVSTYIVVNAAQLGVSTSGLIRMMGNILLETVVGLVPVLGDLFDFAWKANERNLVILRSQLGATPAGGSARRRLGLASGLLLLVFVLVLAGLIVLAFQALAFLLQAAAA